MEELTGNMLQWWGVRWSPDFFYAGDYDCNCGWGPKGKTFGEFAVVFDTGGTTDQLQWCRFLLDSSSAMNPVNQAALKESLWVAERRNLLGGKYNYNSE